MRRVFGVLLLITGALVSTGAAGHAAPGTDWVELDVTAASPVTGATVTYRYTVTPDGSGPAVIGHAIGSPQGGGYADLHALTDEVVLRAATPLANHEVVVKPNGAGGYTTQGHLYLGELTAELQVLNFVDGATISGFTVLGSSNGLSVATTEGSGTTALVAGGATDRGASATATSPGGGAAAGVSRHVVDTTTGTLGVVPVRCAGCFATWTTPGGGGGGAFGAGADLGGLTSQQRSAPWWFAGEAGTYGVDWAGADYSLLFEAPVLGALVPVGDSWTSYAP